MMRNSNHEELILASMRRIDELYELFQILFEDSDIRRPMPCFSDTHIVRTSSAWMI